MSPRGNARLAVLLVGIAAAGLIFYLVLGQDPASSSSSLPASEGGSPDGGGGALGTSPASSGVAAAPAAAGQADPEAAPETSAARLARYAASPGGVKLRAEIDRLRALLASEDAEEEKGDEAEQAWEDAWQRTVEGLISRVTSPDYARLMREVMDAEEDLAFATRLARILRTNQDPQFVAEMRERALESESAQQRQMALLTLESKDAKVWLEPTVKAFSGDAEPQVRDEAAGIVARSMADRKHIRTHDELRGIVADQVRSGEPEQRARALRTMLGDRRAGPAQLELAKAYVEDPDPRVREEAERVVRVLGPRVERLLEKRRGR